MCAVVAIFTFGRRAANTGAAFTQVHLRTGLPVIACRFIVLKDTAHSGLTGIIGAAISILANEEIGAHALAIFTEIGGCTGIVIVTGDFHRDMDAAIHRMTGILRTRLSIIALGDLSRGALSPRTDRTESAEIPIFTGRAFLARTHDAFTGRRITDTNLAGMESFKHSRAVLIDHTFTQGFDISLKLWDIRHESRLFSSLIPRRSIRFARRAHGSLPTSHEESHDNKQE